MDMFLYESVSCLPVPDEPVLFLYMYEKMLKCSHVLDALGKISCKLTVSPSLNKVFDVKRVTVQTCRMNVERILPVIIFHLIISLYLFNTVIQ